MEELARAGLRNPVRVKVAVKSLQEGDEGVKKSSQRIPLGLQIHYKVCKSTEKLAQFIHFLQARPLRTPETPKQPGHHARFLSLNPATSPSCPWYKAFPKVQMIRMRKENFHPVRRSLGVQTLAPRIPPGC